MSAEMYLPTPAQIRAHCRLIQMEWSEHEEEKRRVTRNPPATIHGADSVPIWESPCGTRDRLRATVGREKTWRQRQLDGEE